MEVSSKVEYSPWMLEFKRIDVILRNLHDAYLDMTPDSEGMFRMFNLQRELWRVIRPKVHLKGNTRFKKDKMDLRFVRLDNNINLFSIEQDSEKRTAMMKAVMREIESLYDDLYEIREVVGLGVTMYSVDKRPPLQKLSGSTML